MQNAWANIAEAKRTAVAIRQLLLQANHVFLAFVLGRVNKRRERETAARQANHIVKWSDEPSLLCRTMSFVCFVAASTTPKEKKKTNRRKSVIRFVSVLFGCRFNGIRLSQTTCDAVFYSFSLFILCFPFFFLVVFCVRSRTSISFFSSFFSYISAFVSLVARHSVGMLRVLYAFGEWREMSCTSNGSPR